MHIVRYATATDPGARVGALDRDGLHPVDADGIGGLLRHSAAELRQLLDEAVEGAPSPDAVTYLPTIDGRMEVWAAGVTYRRSREARMEESATADIYELVYDAQRPELFFKCVPWRTVTNGEPVSIRGDSGLDVPEPELTVIVNAGAEIVGYGICDDVSSRSIEGENPLYLPQAKVYAGSCALSAGFRPAWEIAAPGELAISMEIERAGTVAWKGETTSAQLRRTPDELVDYLYREEQFPDGVIISTGTGIVPEIGFTLQAGDVVTIQVAEIGVLSNPVVVGRRHEAWLVDAFADASRRNPSHGGPLAGRPV